MNNLIVIPKEILVELSGEEILSYCLISREYDGFQYGAVSAESLCCSVMKEKMDWKFYSSLKRKMKKGIQGLCSKELIIKSKEDPNVYDLSKITKSSKPVPYIQLLHNVIIKIVLNEKENSGWCSLLKFYARFKMMFFTINGESKYSICQYSISELSKLTEFSKNTVKKYLNKLCDLCIIAKFSRKNKRDKDGHFYQLSNIYCDYYQYEIVLSELKAKNFLFRKSI